MCARRMGWVRERFNRKLKCHKAFFFFFFQLVADLVHCNGQRGTNEPKHTLLP